ncbi:MAG TPA: hypothetical protein VM733_17615 [Thermoanaerobaculia bacterium]|nr:hypothetical protein [Thermoanaerobaculia bacterium]
MDHNEALQSNASDRYALNLLTAAEADAFEEHYFDCATCAEDVRLGMSLMDGGRRLVRSESEPAAPVVPITAHPRRKFLAWIPAAAAAALLAVNGGLLLRGPAAVAPMAIADFALLQPEAVRGAEIPAENTLVLADGEDGQLEMDFPASSEKVRVSIFRGSSRIASYLLVRPQDSLIRITLPDPEPGAYELVIHGTNDPSGKHPITSARFTVKRPTSTR